MQPMMQLRITTTWRAFCRMQLTMQLTCTIVATTTTTCVDNRTVCAIVEPSTNAGTNIDWLSETTVVNQGPRAINMGCDV